MLDPGLRPEVPERAEGRRQSWRSGRPRAAGRPRSLPIPRLLIGSGLTPWPGPAAGREGRARPAGPGGSTDDVLPPLRSLGARPPARQRPDGEGPRPPRVGRCHRRPRARPSGPEVERKASGRPRPNHGVGRARPFESARGGTMRYLVAEDNDLDGALIRLSLARLGHEVTIARDGLEAWRLVEEEGFSLVVSDWMMPKLKAPTSAGRSRSREDRPYLLHHPADLQDDPRGAARRPPRRRRRFPRQAARRRRAGRPPRDRPPDPRGPTRVGAAECPAFRARPVRRADRR